MINTKENVCDQKLFDIADMYELTSTVSVATQVTNSRTSFTYKIITKILPQC
jgi:hypothetical protein